MRWVFFCVFLGSIVGSIVVTPPAWSRDLESDVLSGRIFEQGGTESRSESQDALPATELPEARARDVEAVDDIFLGPRQIPLDNILVVQRRFIRKESRFELMPLGVSIQPADSFRKQLSWSAAGLYHLSQNFSWELLSLTMTSSYLTGVEQSLNEFNGQRLDRLEPSLHIGSALMWVPLSSKTATSREVWYFEGYFLGGGGLTRIGESGWTPAALGGIGARIYVNENAIMKVEFRNIWDMHASEVYMRPNIAVGFSVLLGNAQ